MGSKFTVQKLKSIMQEKKKNHIRERERDNRLESTVENWREKNNTAGIKKNLDIYKKVQRFRVCRV